ncbi:MAG: hypothetical protein IRZ32_17900 [Solirubrobacteraceae bacterium]|nr:hypothetical protein [Solirubrobacteraceae bacterium]
MAELWPAVLDAVRAENGMLAACLGSAQPVGVDGNVVTIAFPRSEAFAYRKADDAEKRDLVAEALRSVTGHPLYPAYELHDELPTVEEAPPLSEEELIARFKDAFDAEEIPPDDEPA